MKQAHLTVTKTLIPTEDMTKTLLLQVGAKLIFGKTMGHLEFWWCLFFHWRFQWNENIRGASCEKDSTLITVFLFFLMK
jgi:hypothetical protein